MPNHGAKKKYNGLPCNFYQLSKGKIIVNSWGPETISKDLSNGAIHISLS